MPRDAFAGALPDGPGKSVHTQTAQSDSHRVDSANELVWLIGSICLLHRVAFDPELALQQVAAPYDRSAALAVMQKLGLDCAERALPDVHAADHGTRIVWLASSDHAVGIAQPALIVAADADNVTLLMARISQPTSLPRHEFRARQCGPVILVRPRPKALSDPDAVAGNRKFGFGWFVPELTKHTGVWRNVLLASLAIQLLALGTPLITQAIIDKVVVHRTESTLIALGTGLLLFMVFSAALTWIRQFLVLHTGMRIDAVLGAAVFRHLIELPPRYFEQRPTGVIAARLHGVEQIRDFLASAAISLVLDLPFLSICLALMFVYSVPLTLIVLGVLALIVTASAVVSPLFQARLNREFLLGARNQAFVTEHVAGMETVKSLQLEPALQRRYGDFLAAHLQAGFATRQLGNTYQSVAHTLEQAMTIAVLVVGAWIVMHPSANTAFTIGMLVAFQMFASRLSQPLLRLVGLWQQFQQARLAVARLGDMMDVPTEPYRTQPTRMLRDDPARAIVELRNVAFRYGEERPFLYEDLNLTLRPGECVVLAGRSGSGKSTLAKLLQGFYLPLRGQILVNGIDSRHLAANELRANFGVVPQETVLFSGTVLDNLLLANPRAGFEDAVRACRMAEIHDVIERLPQGYQTEIGERGAGLSGGQKQRVAIARALLKRPHLLIFDEATSNLDGATTESFARTVNALRGRVAILFITHHCPAGLKPDRVIDLAGIASASARAPDQPADRERPAA